MYGTALLEEASPWSELATETREFTVVSALVDYLAAFGVEESFGVSGGAIALLYDELANSPIGLRHFRHESAAGFAAVEASFASGRPALVFTTTGPGILNVLPSMKAAKADGGRVVLISGCTGCHQKGRSATQETSAYTLPSDLLFNSGHIFDLSVRVEHAAELPQVLRRLQEGLQRPEGFVAHVGVPMAVWNQRLDLPVTPPPMETLDSAPSAEGLARICDLLRLDKEMPRPAGTRPHFVIWVGHGARGASRQVRALAERTGAAVLATPRGKGVFPEKHPQFVGVTGLGGHEAVTRYMKSFLPQWALVLGSRLGELSTLWDSDLQPQQGFIHVDLDPQAHGSSFPGVPTIAVRAEIGQFLDALLPHCPPPQNEVVNIEPWARTPRPETGYGHAREGVLMDFLQRHLVEESDVLILADGGDVATCLNHHLRFSRPRYRTTSYFAARGHFCAGVVGAALARRGKAVAVVSEEAMALMATEISTAVQHRAQAVWIVLNRAGRCDSVTRHEELGLTTDHLTFPAVDQVALAESLGARGLRVQSEDQIDAALKEAMAADGPIVVDIWMESPDIDDTKSVPVVESADIIGW